MQAVGNPVPRIKHPDWLHKKVWERAEAAAHNQFSPCPNVHMIHFYVCDAPGAAYKKLILPNVFPILPILSCYDSQQ